MTGKATDDDDQPVDEPIDRSFKGIVSIDVVSDVMCPWCFIGQKNLARALEMLGEIETDIRWRPYQLDPTLPAEGKDRQQYLNDKFGGEAGARTAYSRVKDAGKAAGIDFNIEAITVSPNTLDAHRLIRWAGGQGAQVQDRMVRRLFEMYFIEGRHIGRHETLLRAADDAGMDREIVAGLLQSDADVQAVKDEINQARQMGVRGVPFFVIGGKYGISGAQPPQVLADAIRKVAGYMAEAAK